MILCLDSPVQLTIKIHVLSALILDTFGFLIRTLVFRLILMSSLVLILNITEKMYLNQNSDICYKHYKEIILILATSSTTARHSGDVLHTIQTNAWSTFMSDSFSPRYKRTWVTNLQRAKPKRLSHRSRSSQL